MFLSYCLTCMENWNPMFLAIKHKDGCKEDLSKKAQPKSCTRCGSCVLTHDGEINHQEWCVDRKKPESLCPSCKSIGVFLEGSVIHDLDCPLYSSFVKGMKRGVDVFKTDFSEIRMSVDGLIARASKVASEAHRDQFQKYSGDPYVWHPMRVAGRVMLLSYSSPLEVAAAWLHDTLKPYNEKPAPMLTTDLADRGVPQQVIDMVVLLTNPSMCLVPGQTVTKEKALEMDCRWFSNQPKWVQKIKILEIIDDLMGLSYKDEEGMMSYCNEARKMLESIGATDLDLKQEAMSIVAYWEGELITMAQARSWE